MTTIIGIDEWLFSIINQDLHNPVLDFIMPYWREKTTWIPLYIALAAFLIIKFKKKGLFLIVGLLLSVSIADVISSHVIKKQVQRLRPCNQEKLQEEVKLLVRCGTGYSFTSSHATNHFAIALFLIFTLGRIYKKIKWPFLIWAATIALGQVYVGVHFPFDILVGALLGSLIGWSISLFYYQFPKLSIGKEIPPLA